MSNTSNFLWVKSDGTGDSKRCFLKNMYGTTVISYAALKNGVQSGKLNVVNVKKLNNGALVIDTSYRGPYTETAIFMRKVWNIACNNFYNKYILFFHIEELFKLIRDDLTNNEKELRDILFKAIKSYYVYMLDFEYSMFGVKQKQMIKFNKAAITNHSSICYYIQSNSEILSIMNPSTFDKLKKNGADKPVEYGSLIPVIEKLINNKEYEHAKKLLRLLNNSLKQLDYTYTGEYMYAHFVIDLCASYKDYIENNGAIRVLVLDSTKRKEKLDKCAYVAGKTYNEHLEFVNSKASEINALANKYGDLAMDFLGTVKKDNNFNKLSDDYKDIVKLSKSKVQDIHHEFIKLSRDSAKAPGTLRLLTLVQRATDVVGIFGGNPILRGNSKLLEIVTKQLDSHLEHKLPKYSMRIVNEIREIGKDDNSIYEVLYHFYDVEYLNSLSLKERKRVNPYNLGRAGYVAILTDMFSIDTHGIKSVATSNNELNIRNRDSFRINWLAAYTLLDNYIDYHNMPSGFQDMLFWRIFEDMLLGDTKNKNAEAFHYIMQDINFEVHTNFQHRHVTKIDINKFLIHDKNGQIANV